jgi:hypothetical protein
MNFLFEGDELRVHALDRGGDLADFRTKSLRHDAEVAFDLGDFGWIHIDLEERPAYTRSSFEAIALPSTRARILANAVSREVEVSSPNGEKPQSSVEPR